MLKNQDPNARPGFWDRTKKWLSKPFQKNPKIAFQTVGGAHGMPTDRQHEHRAGRLHKAHRQSQGRARTMQRLHDPHFRANRA